MSLRLFTARRSVQTALSLAESIGYSTDFVIQTEDPAPPTFQPVPDGLLLASMLCLGAVVLIFAATASYIVLTLVA